MGCVSNITKFKFPKQSDYVGTRVNVCFHYDTQNSVNGTIVRDDREEPYVGIIQLDSGRYVLDTECQYSHIYD